MVRVARVFEVIGLTIYECVFLSTINEEGSRGFFKTFAGIFLSPQRDLDNSAGTVCEREGKVTSYGTGRNVTSVLRERNVTSCVT